MSEVSGILDILRKAVDEGRTVTIKIDEVTIKADESSANGVEITVE